MSSEDQSSYGHAGITKYDQRLGPDTDGAAIALYRQYIELLYKVTFPPEAMARFWLQAVTYQLPRAAVSSVESVAQTLSRGPAEIARGGDQFLVWLQVSGESDANYAGRECKLRPGDVVILDYAREIFVRAPDFASIYVMIERNMVPPHSSRPRCTAPSLQPRAAPDGFSIARSSRCSRRWMRSPCRKPTRPWTRS